MPVDRRRPHDDGFTIVEVMMASLVLVTGMLGVLSLLSGALKTTRATDERVAATNLARELVEQTRSLDYDDMSGTLVQGRLQARGLGSGSPWKIERRGIIYTITVRSCTFDDPADRLVSPPPPEVCTPQPTGSTGDANGDDFRRTTFDIAWTETAGGASRSVTQTTLVGNPSGGLGPRIVSFDPVTQTITANVGTADVVWTTTPAQSLRWTVDDGSSAGSSSGSTTFTTSWHIGSSGATSPTAGEILDGAYEISAQPFDARNVPGEVKRANVVLNRRQPYPPQSFAGGHDTRLVDRWVDLQWSPNRERDILGYRVLWAGVDGVAGNGDDTQVCPAPSAGSMLPASKTRCADFSPPAGATTYYIVAIDRAPDNQLRAGDRQTLSIDAAGARPAAPSQLEVQTVEGEPRLSWIASASSDVSFYRIYRDGTTVAHGDRYDRTTGTTTGYADDNPGSVSRTYWVTAVNSSFNESDPIGPVTWP